MPSESARAIERVLARLIFAWAAVGLALTAFFGVLLRALGWLALGFWVGYALAAAVLAPLTLAHARHASSRVVGLALASAAPAIAAALWLCAGVLRGAGNAVALWLSAI